MNDAAEIIPGLYQGARPEAINADVVVCLTRRAPDYLPDQAEAGRFLLLWWPIDDGPMPRSATVRSIATFVASLLDDDHRVLVHCWGGNNRSGLVVARTLIELGRDPQEAIKLVRAAIPTALNNTAFERWLLDEISQTSHPDPSLRS